MLSVRVGLTTFLVTHLILLLSVPVLGDDERDYLLQGLNSYRRSQGAAPLQMHDKAGCLADKIADEIQDRPCPPGGVPTTTSPGIRPQLTNYPALVKECNIDINNTLDGVILPVCVPKRVATLVLTNYTLSPYSASVNSTKYTGVGIGLEDDWTVLVLTTNTAAGSFASAACFTCFV
ncbi:uncharacterized GPI-anchored protein At3g06035-like [Coffea arabica]|uniref:Uncharacterized GPI-anchored protein At3g06035-like n=1 Tax=Coffea arabica TaxID=13443 RepID=A0A6P6W4M6_COFAR|nr:uncharacterized GPI-anchored protein At3g06035-like [Coffea arabica]